MKPYYEHGGITIYHGDCRAVLARDAAFRCGQATYDLLLTDPPYGIKACDRSDGGVGSIASGSKHYGRVKWDGATSPEALAVARSLCRLQVIFGGNYYDLPPTSCWLIWNKCQRDFSFADAELAWTNLSKSVRIFDYGRGALVAEGKDHPTQKPEPLMRWCIQQCGDARTILDPFMGSGTTLVAAKNMGRRAIGIEIEERYCEIAAKRLAQEVLPLEAAV
jgi:site-specific DNA-methyltransferase (adenine-specific)